MPFSEGNDATRRPMNPGPGGIRGFPSMRKAWAVIAILWIVTLFSQLDRQLPALLVKPLKGEFGITDTQFSLLQGYAFALVYTAMGLPFGRLVDRANRRNLILFGVVVWSAMTVFAGFATSFGELLVARIGVGVGEAVLAPAAYSIIADYVAPARRGRALSVYYVSLAIGSGASLLLGGMILHMLPAAGLQVGALVLTPWRTTFILAGLPGLPLVLLLLLVREPERHETQGIARASIGDFLAYLREHRATFWRLLTYPALIAAIGYGMLAWAPAYFERRFGLPIAQVGVTLGIIVAAAGLTGTLASGALSDRWLAQGKPAARFRVTLVGWMLIVPSASFWPLMPSAIPCFALLAVLVTGTAIAQSAAPAAVQDVFTNTMRGQAIAVYLLLAGLVGIGLGPMLVALVTDHVFGDPAKLGYSLVAVAVPMTLFGLWLSISGQRPYAQTLEALRRGRP
ncbi:MFS transporter [Sphingomonas sp. A2-49]|uniref:MFS transporter n=1 Tax=Sphingomonas sp. A2-49 TaxID=1391375 RepID=UPI0021CFAA35|nr:MFS transporter [Sphingomonas sp. A2-49]MCU6453133.1 MFS transporter [Sphingomonas sp. A2-49]